MAEMTDVVFWMTIIIFVATILAVVTGVIDSSVAAVLGAALVFERSARSLGKVGIEQLTRSLRANRNRSYAVRLFVSADGVVGAAPSKVTERACPTSSAVLIGCENTMSSTSLRCSMMKPVSTGPGDTTAALIPEPSSSSRSAAR